MTIRRNGHRTPIYARALAAFRWRMSVGLVPVYGAAVRRGAMHQCRQNQDGPDAA